MALLYIKHYTRAYIQAHRDWLFVFGDNLERRGRGRQAAEARGEPNAIGIATKRAPRRDVYAYLSDQDYDEWHTIERMNLFRLKEAARHGRTVIWPLNGIGTGLAELEQRAPMIWAQIETLRFAMENG